MKRVLLALAALAIVPMAHGQTLRSLASGRGFTIGCGDTDPSIFNTDATFNSLVAAQCNSIEPGNVMKQNAMEPNQCFSSDPTSCYTWSNADAVMNFAATNTQSVTATAPVWDNASYGGGTPSWVSGLSSGALTTALQNYVAAFMNHMHTNYPGRMKQIALVSEASHQCPNAGYDSGYGTGPLCSILGLDGGSSFYAGHVHAGMLFPAYLKLAYTQARATDPTAQLCYDDWGWEGSGGSSSNNYQYWVVAYLKSLGLVDCVGLKGQWQYNTIPNNVPSTASISSTISAYQSLGVSVYFSQVELGIHTNGTNNTVPNSYTSTVPADLTTQANLYSALVNACLGNAACNAFYVWGIGDKWAFIDAPSPFGIGAPQLYDASYNPKPAYTAVQSALASGGGGGGGCTPTTTSDPGSFSSALAGLATGGTGGSVCNTATVHVTGASAWTTGFTYTVPSGLTNLTIQGDTAVTCSGTAGQSSFGCTAADSTILTDNYAGNNPLITINANTASNALLRITGFTINGGSGGSKYNGWIEIYSGNSQVRIDHNHPNEETYSGGTTGVFFRTYGGTVGVADHNLFDLSTNNTNYPFAISDFAAYNDTVGNGDGTFNHATPWGANSSWSVESNVLNGGVINDCGNAGSMVIRYNTINDASVGIQTHGTKSPAGPARGCRSIEMYNNYFTGPSGSPQSAALGTKGTTAMIWGNNMASGYRRFYQGGGDRQSGDETETSTPAGWGYCGTAVAANNVGSNWDGNNPTPGTPTASGYPCLDGLGRGQTPQSLNGLAFPNRLNLSSGTIAWPHQYLEPQYLWNNTLYVGATAYMLLSDGSVNNQDYFYDCGTWNSSCSGAFTGAAGTGFGTLASRPATCTPGAGGTYLTSPTGSQGTFYFATNVSPNSNGGVGRGFACTATNTWTDIYDPAVYPNPLVSGVVSTPTFAPGGGSYAVPQSVVISTATPAATIYYTIDGTTPTTASTVYSTPVNISTPTLLQAIAVASGLTQSGVGSANYTFNPTCADPTQQGPPGFPSQSYSGTYASAVSAGFTSPTAGCIMHITMDGSTPTSGSPVYTGPYTISTTTTLRTIAIQAGYANSNISGGTWTISAVPSLTISAAGTGSGTIGGSNCAVGSSFPASGTGVVCNAAGLSGATVTSSGTGAASACTGPTCSFTFLTTSSTLTYTFAAQIPTPVFTPGGGSYGSVQTVAITDSQGGVTLCYTTDGSTPTGNGAGSCTHGTTYSTPISVGSTQTLRAIATAATYADSGVLSATYTINLVAPPAVSGNLTLSGRINIP